MLSLIQRYLTAGALALAVAGAGWGWIQGQRLDRAEAAARRADERAAAAGRDLAQCRADQAARRGIDDAVSDIGELLPDALTGWLRDRAAAAD